MTVTGVFKGPINLPFRATDGVVKETIREENAFRMLQSTTDWARG
jgi:hypothetical protein